MDQRTKNCSSNLVNAGTCSPSTLAVAVCALSVVACAVSEPDIYRDRFNGNRVVEIEPQRNGVFARVPLLSKSSPKGTRANTPLLAALLERNGTHQRSTTRLSW